MFKIRDKETFILFIIGFGLSFFIVLNGYHLLNAWFTQMVKSQSETSYLNHVQFTAATDVPERRQQTMEEGIAEQQQAIIKADDLLHILSRQTDTTYLKDISLPIGCRTDFADIQNKKECGGNRQWQRRFLRNWAADTKGKEII